MMSDGPVSRVQRLISTTRSGGGDVRPALLRVVVDLFVTSSQPIAEETRRFSELSLRLIERADPETLRAIAKQLAACPYAPSPVLWRLSQCEARISAELIERGANFTDDMLLTLIKQGDAAKVAAIARRPSLSLAVERALRESGVGEVDSTLNGTVDAMPEPAVPPLEAGEGAVKAAPLAASGKASARFYPNVQPGRIIKVVDGEVQPPPPLLSRHVQLTPPAKSPAPAPVAARPAPKTAAPLAPNMAEPFAAVKPDQARLIRTIERATLQQKPLAIIGAIAEGLGLSTGFVAQLMQDESGETTIFLLKALGFGKDVLSKTLITCHPPIAMSVTQVYRLVNMYDSIPVEMVAAIRSQWKQRDMLERDSAPAKVQPVAEPLLSARTAASHPPRITLTPPGKTDGRMQKI